MAKNVETVYETIAAKNVAKNLWKTAKMTWNWHEMLLKTCENLRKWRETDMKNIFHKWPLTRPEVTFNDLEGQKYIAYDASVYTMSMHAKNQVNRCSG